MKSVYISQIYDVGVEPMLSKLGSKAVEGLKFVSNSGGSLALELSNGGMFSNGGIDDVDKSNG